MRVGRWLGTLILIALLFGVLFVPACHAQTVRADHPRVLMTPEILAKLKARASANAASWVKLKAACDGNLGSTDPYDVSVQNFALAYLMTGDTRYSTKAAQLMELKVSLGLGAISGDSYYPTRSVLPAAAMGYDWIYSTLSDAQRSRFRAQMEAWADAVWPETNASRAGAWGARFPGSNYYSGFLCTWMIGLSLSGDSSKAAGYIMQAKRRWHDEVLPYLDAYAKGSYLLDGTNYGPGSAHRFWMLLTSHKTATGEDLFAEPAFASWPSDWVRTEIHVTAPDLKHVLPSGDQSRVAEGIMGDLDRWSVLGALAAASLPAAVSGVGRVWLDRTPTTRQRADLWVEFMWDPSGVPAVDPLMEPTGRLAESAGLALARTGWGTGDTFLALECGKGIEDHQDRAQGELFLWRNGWLMAPARVWSASGLYKETPNHSTYLLGSQGQAGFGYSSPRNGSRVRGFADSSTTTFIDADFTDAYAGLLRAGRRRVFWLKPDRALIFDDLESVDPAPAKKCLFHTKAEPTVVNGARQAANAGSVLRVQTLLPADARVTTTRMSLGSGGAASSWRLDVATPGGRARDRFLHALWVGAEMDASAAPNAVLGAEIATGVQTLTFGDTQVTFDDRVEASAVAYPATALRQVWVTPWPDKPFSVVARVSAAVETRIMAKTDASGILTFDVPFGSSIALFPGDVVLPPPPPLPPPLPPPPPPPVPGNAEKVRQIEALLEQIQGLQQQILDLLRGITP